MAQFKVPQKIDLEDKIFGPLTLMQFLYLMGGGMIVYAAFELATPALFWIIAIPTALLSLSLAFVKIQDQPFLKFLSSAVLYMAKPRKRVWSKSPKDEKFKQETMPKKSQEKKVKKQSKQIEKSELEKLAGILDTQEIKKANEHQGIKNNPKTQENKQTNEKMAKTNDQQQKTLSNNNQTQNNNIEDIFS